MLRNQLVQIALLDGAQVLYLAVFEGRQRFPMSASVGDRYPASVTAVGTALLSELTPGQVAELYWDTSNLVGFTKKSTSTLAELQEKLERTRVRGDAVDEGEVHPTVLGLAIPIPGGSGEPSFAIGVSIVHPTGSVDERENHPVRITQRRRQSHPPPVAHCLRVDDISGDPRRGSRLLPASRA